MRSVSVRVKPSAKRRSIIFDKEKGLYIAELKSPPEDGRANLELIRMFEKKFKAKARIVRGKRSKRKVLHLID